VFRNILQNAVVHGGATAVEIRLDHPSSSTASIAFHDNGRGVPAARLADLGAPFSRVSETSGTGVGLYVSRQIVARLGGSLTFAMDASQGGLIVSVELPSAR
jgi:signal transduction histidine kinase